MIKTFKIATMATIVLLSACSAEAPQDGSTNSPATATGDAPQTTEAQIIEYEEFLSSFVKPRNISVWLPSDYKDDGSVSYPVIYAHDGQNLFQPGFSYGGVEWGLDETAERMMSSGELKPAIIVGIWNTDQRWPEYAPQKVIERLSGDASSEWLGHEIPELKGDAYLRFIVEELKPFIDSTFETSPGADDTLIMGSSMGGLISLYAVAEYPSVFSRAAAVSIHWPLAEPESSLAAEASDVMQSYLETSGIDPMRHTLWFDRGTEELDEAYAPHAVAMEDWFRANGWSADQAIFRDYPGTGHNEAAWAERVDQVFTFLLAD